MHKTTTFAMLGTALVVLTPMAQAQDVNYSGKTDIYGGVLAGLSASHGSISTGFGTGDYYSTPGSLGLLLGARWHQNGILFGVEGDASLALSDSTGASGAAVITGSNGEGHIRGQIGADMGNVSLFVSGGLALDSIKYNSIVTGATNQMMVGWTAGVGADIAANDNLAIRIEALHDDTSAVMTDGYNGKWANNTVRVGAIFKF